MFWNYLKLAFRQIGHNKTYSAINIIGLSAGLAACFCILIFVNYQLSYDKHNDKLNNIYQASTKLSLGYYKASYTEFSVAANLKTQMPEVIESARWRLMQGGFMLNNDKIAIKRCVSADMSIFNILTLPLVVGDNKELEKERDFIIINETIAKKYFNNTDPLGKILSFTSFRGKPVSLKIRGIMKDIPSTSTFAAEVIVPFQVFEDYLDSYTAKMNPQVKKNQKWAYTYVLLNPNSAHIEINKKLDDFSVKNGYSTNDAYFELFPLKDLYFHYGEYLKDNGQYSPFPSGNMTNIYIYSGAALIIIFMALLNYLLLGVGRAALRSKEVCVRKVVGAGKKDLFKQTTVEAIAVTFLSLPFAVILLEYLLPYVSQLFGREIPSSYFHNFTFLLFSLGITVFVGILTGAYVSLYLSRFNPLEIMKNKFVRGSGRATFRRVMIGVQLVIAIGLIFTIITVNKQLTYFKSGIKGFDKENMLILLPKSQYLNQNYEAFKSELKKNNNITDVSSALFLPGSQFPMTYRTAISDKPEKEIWADYLEVDEDFIETMKMKMKAGVSFRQYNTAANNKICLINESAAKELGSDSPIGKTINEAEIIGVVKDFHNGSFKSKIGPVIINLNKQMLNEIVIRINPQNIASILDFIQEKSRQFKNAGPMVYEFYDDYLLKLYGNENSFSQIMNYAAIIALIIACLGLFGMSLFVTQQRVKEIGIRKVVGASVKDIYTLLTKEFITLSIFASLIAFPIAYYLINTWLNDFVYKTTIDIWVFILSGAIGIGVVLLTISFQAIKVSLANPVKSLRSE